MMNPRSRKHALEGSGPIVDRARAALRRTAAEFGEIVSSDQTTVTARTPDGIDVTLSYDGGNFVFSRVYNLTMQVLLPPESGVPTELKLSHRPRSGPQFVRAAPHGTRGGQLGVGGLGRARNPVVYGGLADRLTAMHRSIGDLLRSVDLIAAAVSGPRAARTLTLTPLGGSYVWVLIPPVFKSTSFPAGEPQRLLDIVRTLRTWTPVSA